MKKILLSLLISFCAIFTAQSVNLDSLYKCLDKEVNSSSIYVTEHENKISTLKKMLDEVEDSKEKYNISFKIFKEYKSFINDSALTYIEKCIEFADKINRKDLSDNCKSLLAFQCSTAGMYTESLDILRSINKKHLKKEGLGNYYIAFNHVYGELSYYTQLNHLRAFYANKANAYRDSVYYTVDPSCEDYLLKKEIQLVNENRLEEALKVNDERLKKVTYGTHEYAIVSYYRSQIFRSMNQLDSVKCWLALSAISDIRNSVMDHASLWNLADLLNKDGDLDRSYKYIKLSWNATTVFNARVRSWLASPILSMIDNKYQTSIKERNEKLRTFVIVISVLSVLLLIGVFYVNHQRKKLSMAMNQMRIINNQLKELNDELSIVNDNLDKSNHDLSVVNEKLSYSNSRLNESNRVKEEYIGRFLSLCSIYIDKLDGFRKQVNKKMKNNEMEQLFQLTKSLDFRERELTELYSNFDDAFLHLFPNFVEEFNALLKEDSKITLTDVNILTTELRIFALIRLGIDDSSKIADFLHYSVNTIYNYRARVKNNANGNREDFERRVRSIGLTFEK